MLFFYLQVAAQTAPIQNGSANYDGDIYHQRGDIGIGTSAPTSRLHILKGSLNHIHASSDFIKVETENIQGGFPPTYTYTTNLILKQNGNLGINTNNPLEKLHVNGSIRGGETAGALKLQTDYGFLRVGALSVNYMNFTTDLPKFYFNKGVRVDGGIYIYNNSTGLGSGNYQIALNSDGTIRAREIKVDLDYIPVPDYVFAEDYKLMPLAEVKTFIEANKHLPNVKSEAQFKEEGSISLTEMNMKLLEKVEELTLYILQQEQRIQALENNGGVK